MATKNIVPRADGEGSIGKTAKKWFQGFFKKLTVETELNAPTVTASDNSTKVATTAHVKNNVPKSVGSGTKPVYTDSNGKVTASGSNVGDDDTPMYLSGGTMTAMSGTLFSKIVTHLASATAATISSLNTSSLFYRMLTWALTASGVQYNLTNSSAWYVCLGSLFGDLIIQGGSTYINSTSDPQIASNSGLSVNVATPITFSKLIGVFGRPTTARSDGFTFRFSASGNSTLTVFAFNASNSEKNNVAVGWFGLFT